MDSTRINIVENIVGNLTVNMNKLFDKGEIDQLYSRMYEVAERRATLEAGRYLSIQKQELRQEWYAGDPQGLGPDVLKYSKRVEKYRNTRLNFHLNEMRNLLELYVQSKDKSTS